MVEKLETSQTNLLEWLGAVARFNNRGSRMCVPLLVHGRISYRVSTRRYSRNGNAGECRNVAMHDFANSRGGRVKVKLEHESQLVKRDRRICSILYIGAMTKLNLLGKN